jgi:hypothetical protein
MFGGCVQKLAGRGGRCWLRPRLSVSTQNSNRSGDSSNCCGRSELGRVARRVSEVRAGDGRACVARPLALSGSKCAVRSPDAL